MKKGCLIFAMILCLLLGGCGEKEMPAAATRVEQEPVEPMPAEPPPYMLRFQSTDELETFFTATAMTDEAFEDYIDRKGYDMNGIHSKEDLLSLKEQLAEVPFPEISGGVLSTAWIEPERGWMYVVYALEHEDSVEFQLKFTERHSDRTQVDFEPSFQKSTSHWYEGMVDGYTISCGYFGSKSAASEAIEAREITFRPVAEFYHREELAVESILTEPSPQALNFYSIEELKTFFETTAMTGDDFQNDIEQLALAPFPEVSDGTLVYVSIDTKADQAYVRYDFAQDGYCVFQIDYAKQLGSDMQQDFAFVEEAQSGYGFENNVKGYRVVYWHFGEVELARTVIDQKTTYRSWANIWTVVPAKEQVFSNLEAFESAMCLDVCFIPQGIPAEYTLGRIIVDAAYARFIYFPTDAQDSERQRQAQALGDCFEFSFCYKKPEKIYDADFIWNEDHHLFYWALDGYVFNLKLPNSHSPEQYEPQALCAVENVVS